MKTIGLIGGMSFESTMTYYQIINETIQQHLGGLHSAKVLLYSVDFAEIEEYQSKGQWDSCAKVLSKIALNLEKAGADYIVICTNTIHKIAPEIQKHITIPMIHVVDTVVEELKKSNILKVGLLGTKYTMAQDFYKNKLIDAGIEVMIPNEEDIEIVNNVIFNELCHGILLKESKQKYKTIINELERRGAQGIVLGCTEIGLLIQQNDIKLPVFDTTQIHATKAALLAIEKTKEE